VRTVMDLSNAVHEKCESYQQAGRENPNSEGKATKNPTEVGGVRL